MDAQTDLRLCCSHMAETGSLVKWLICLVIGITIVVLSVWLNRSGQTVKEQSDQGLLLGLGKQ